jgi:hypothetical protein
MSIQRHCNAIKMLSSIGKCQYEMAAPEYICGVNKTKCVCSVHWYKPAFIKRTLLPACRGFQELEPPDPQKFETP